MKDNTLAIIGWHEGTAGQIHSWLKTIGNFEVICFVNPSDEKVIIDKSKDKRDSILFEYPLPDSFKKLPLYSVKNWAETLKKLKIQNVILTHLDCEERMEAIRYASINQFNIVNIIHPTVILSDEALLGKNLIFHPKSFIGYRAEIRDGVIINTGAQVDHHCVIKECVTIDPGVIMAGNVTIGEFTIVHTGAIIKNRIRIGSKSIIGAGAVVIDDVPDYVTIVGNPGRILKNKK